MNNPSRKDVVDFLTYMMRYPATYYGKEVKFGRAFGSWVLTGTPAE